MSQLASTRAHVAALQRLLANKLHVLPGAGERPPGELLAALVACFRPLPTALLRWWASHPRGHVVVAGGESHRYAVGSQAAGRRIWENVVWLNPEEAGQRTLVLGKTAHLLDHLLGCHGEEGGLWLSDGGGLTETWRQVGQRLRSNAALGYGPEDAATDPHAYFAWGLSTYLLDRQALNVDDPLLERLLRTTVLSDDYWRATPIPLPAAPPEGAR